jgi:hypothetical protein
VCHAPGGYLLAVAFGDDSPEVRHGADEPPVPQFGDSVADSPPVVPLRSVMSFSDGSCAPGASLPLVMFGAPAAGSCQAGPG